MFARQKLGRTTGRACWRAPRAWFAGLLLGLAGFAWAEPAGGGRLKASPEEVKASYIRIFAKTTVWPASAFASDSAPFVIGLLGAKPLQNPLTELMRKEKLQGRSVEVRALQSAEDAKSCHVVCFGPQEPDSLRRACRLLGHGPVLTISEQKDGLAAGSILNFWHPPGSVRFEFGRESMTRAGLRVSADVIELAQPGPGKGGAP